MRNPFRRTRRFIQPEPPSPEVPSPFLWRPPIVNLKRMPHQIGTQGEHDPLSRRVWERYRAFAAKTNGNASWPAFLERLRGDLASSKADISSLVREIDTLRREFSELP